MAIKSAALPGPTERKSSVRLPVSVVDPLQGVDQGRQLAADMNEQVVDNLCRENDIPVFRQFFHDHAERVVIRDIHPRHQPPQEAGNQMAVQMGEFPGRKEAGYDDLAWRYRGIR